MVQNTNTSNSLDWKAVRLFAMDVDGILTDGGLYVASDGSEMKRFSIIDGLGLARLRNAEFPLAWISGRPSPATTARAEELRIPHLMQGRIDKAEALQELMNELNLESSQVAYMGDDEIDARAIELAGIGIAVPEAQPIALDAADYVTQRAGGHGAVREVCNLIWESQKGNDS